MIRKRMILRSAHTCLLALAGIISFANYSHGSGENQVQYKVVLRLRTKGAQPLLKLRIWLPHQEITKPRLLELCKILRETYNKDTRIEADVFSSEEGAKKFSDVSEFPGYTEYYSTWRARYWLDRVSGEEYLEYSDGPNQVGKPMQKIYPGKTNLTQVPQP